MYLYVFGLSIDFNRVYWIKITSIMNNRKEIQDKLSWDNINQLHNAVSNFSRQSFDIKKAMDYC